MSQCVPSWDLDDVTPSSRLPLRSRSNSNIVLDVPLLDYEVAELTWENGQIAMHSLGPPRVPSNKYAPPQWDKPHAGGTLESIVTQATRPNAPRKLPGPFGGSEELIPWFDRNAAAVQSKNNNTTTTTSMDARVPCAAGAGGDRDGGGAAVGSCSGAAAQGETGSVLGKRVRVAAARMPGSGPEWSGPAASVSGTSASQQMRAVESSERDFGVSMGSPENASSGKPSAKAASASATATAGGDDHDSICHSRLQRESGDEDDEEDKKKGKSSISSKRSRAAAIHNQSERKRRDKINQRMKTLQKLVPNSSKTDKASMLDEVIDYLKQLQAQVQMMSRMNMPAAMMLPVAMQQQLQLSMMNPMAAMGLGMGLGIDMTRTNLTGIPPILPPNPFMQIPAWDAADARLPLLQDPLSSFFACQSQPMTVEAYSRMAAMYQQLHQPPASSSKS